MDFTKKQIKAIRRAFPNDWNEKLAADHPEAAAEDCLTSSAETVDVVYSWGPGEPYQVSICGVPGAYFVCANEFDNVGVFDTLDEACDARDRRWAGVSLFESVEDTESDAEEQGFV